MWNHSKNCQPLRREEAGKLKHRKDEKTLHLGHVSTNWNGQFSNFIILTFS